LAQENQLHDSNSDSPQSSVLLDPSMTSRSEEVPPDRLMIPVKVFPSP